jgi:hypothetical protein
MEFDMSQVTHIEEPIDLPNHQRQPTVIFKSGGYCRPRKNDWPAFKAAFDKFRSERGDVIHNSAT